MKESYLFLAQGFEEVEALTAVDLLRRAGISVKTVSITPSHKVKGAHDVIVDADLLFTELSAEDPAWIILPGGMPGATNLYECEPLRALIQKQVESENGRIAAICAAPAVVLGQMDLLEGKHATCYPGFEPLCRGAHMEAAPVVVSGKFVLANGPANAMPWALRIIAEDKGCGDAKDVAEGLLYNPVSADQIKFTFG